MSRTVQSSRQAAAPSARTLLAAAARITGEPDRATVDAALVTTLAELWDVDEIRLHALIQGKVPMCRQLVTLSGGRLLQSTGLSAEHDLPLTRLAGASQALELGSATVPCRGGCAMVFPIRDHHQRATRLLQLLGPCDRLQDDRRMVQALLTLYQNHLNVIEDSELDSLTGLRNRRTFDHLLGSLLADRRGATRSPAISRRRQDVDGSWLAVLDIDRFKSINDRFGHLIGDEVLILVANLMSRSFRAGDALFRFGGEEFVVVLGSVDGAGAGAAVERFRRNLEAQQFPQVGSITVSGGYTEIAAGELSSEVLNRADAALYYAKENGRNRTCCYETLLAEGRIGPTQPAAAGGVELF